MMTENNVSGVHPVGWRVLVRPRVVARETAGGIALPDDVVEKNTVVVQVGQVVEMGNSAFSNTDLFPGCRAPYALGDWVLFAPHTGIGVEVEEDGTRVQYRIMNDDHIIGKTDTPDTVRSTIL